MEKDIMNLLDTQNQVMVNILDLISDNNRWYTVNEISMELMVVERTVQRYIHRLQELVNDYNEEKHHLVVIHYEKYKGVRLEIDSGSNYMELKSYILENDETMQIFKLIIFEEFESISKYAADNYVSESSIRKSLKKIKQFLSNYQLSLSRSSFRIEGEEKQKEYAWNRLQKECMNAMQSLEYEIATLMNYLNSLAEANAIICIGLRIYQRKMI